MNIWGGTYIQVTHIQHTDDIVNDNYYKIDKNTSKLILNWIATESY